MIQITVRNIPAAVESRLRTMADRLGLSLNQTVIRLCLDTTASSRLMRGQPKLRERLESADGVLLPVTVLGELHAGFKGGSRLARRHGSPGLAERSGVGEDGGPIGGVIRTWPRSPGVFSMARVVSFLPRRRVVAGLALGVAALLSVPTGCSRSAAPPRPQRPQRPEAEPASGGPPAGATGGMSAGTIGVSLLTLDNPFFKLIGDTIAAKAREKTLYAQVVSADKDVAKQGNQVKDFIVRKVSAIVLSPCDSKAIGPVIAEANAAGIPVFTVDIPYRGSDAKVVTQIATDNFGGGKEAATAMIEALGAGGGKVAILHFKQAESCLLRVGGFREVIDAHNKALPAGHAAIEIVAELEAGGARDSGYKAAEDALQAHADLRGIFAINDPSALGAVGALEKAGKTAQVTVVGFDGQPEGKEAIRDGKIYADPIQFPVKMGEQIVDAIVRHSKGEELPPEMFIPTSLYRKADAESDPALRPAGEPAPAN